MNTTYEVRYLLNGEELTAIVEANSAAEASEKIRLQVSSEGDTFELIQVSVNEDAS